ncbi:hypothetical protein HG536_0F02190 [Torulaspora globosa]|uniref:Telomere-associated protein Rif1 N-terminal domain-containing protein n=1 Tax=Torulaspora globosa TaxID=48254 RepID=A0A7G3ZK58_9SACH|nr:uncharacterized protein HG536_0F02190 [Torulaspora globosa]QLL33894.1 hypothetical protein HG536_0F02190 [Torulaspora globosa]
MSKQPPEDRGEARKMNTFNNLISQLLNKRSPTKSQSQSKTLHLLERNQSLPPANGERQEPLDDSPTPKRRKLAQSSPIGKAPGPTPSSSKSEPAGSSIFAINNENVRLSPAAKTVAFSDEVKSSPTQRTIGSSSFLFPASKPSKSILRNGIGIEKSVSDLTYDKLESSSKLAGRGKPLEHFSRAKDPSCLEFWTSGEVHNLGDARNVKEFRQVLDGGLMMLARTDSESVARRFEIYATFNTIITVLPAVDASEVMERRATQVIGSLDRIVNICLPQLKAEQKKLLDAEDKKDPFVSRLYIQILRFFGSLLSNYRIVRSLTKVAPLRDRLKEVFELSSVALIHQNSNKAIIGAQFSFLADEKYGPYFMNRDEVSNIIHAVLNTKEIQSANLVCEKLFLLKRLISKHTSVMLQLLPLWLPKEVLSRTLMEDDSCTITILQAAISVLLELLKKSIDSSIRQHDIVKCVRESLAKDTLPEKLRNKSLNDGNMNYSTMTLEELVQKQITYLIVFKKEYKLAMDLWLAMMGLLYNTTRTLLELSDSDARGWLKLNHICFLSGDSPIKLIALKAWRIIIYCTWSHIKGKSSAHDFALVRILKKPFDFTANHESDLNVGEGLLYYLTGLIYTTCGAPKSHKADMFPFFWNQLIAPIYSQYIFKSGNILFRSRAIKLLLKLISKEREDKSHKLERKRTPVIKVISTSGVALNDIQPVPASLLQASFESVMRLIFCAIRSDLADWAANYELFISLVDLLPSELADEMHFNSFLEIALELSKAGKSSISSDMFLRLSSAMAGPFGDLIIRDGKIFETLVEATDHLPEHQADSKLKLLKEFSKKLKGRVSDLRIMEIFVGIDDASCKQYVSNWIGSVILSPEISPTDYKSLLRIVQSVRSAEAIENLLRFCSKFVRNVNLFELLQLGEWNDEQYIRFVKVYVSYNSHRLEYPEDLFKEQLKDALGSREKAFKQVVPELIRHKLFDVIKEVIASNLRLADILLSEYGSSSSAILPVDQLPNFILNLQTFSGSGQLFITKWALSLDNPEELFAGGKAFFDFIFHLEPDGSVTGDRRALIDQILERLYEHGSWANLSDFIKVCIACHQTSPVEQLFKIKGSRKLRLLSPAAIAFMVDKCGSLNADLKEYIKEAYYSMNVDFILEVTGSLLDLRKVECFDFWGAQFLVFFITKAQSFENSVQNECRELFKKFINILLDQSDKLIIPFVGSMLKIMASDVTSYTLDLFDFLIQHSKTQPVLENLKYCNDLVEKLRKGVPLEEADLVEPDGANSKDKIGKPNELIVNHLKGHEELQKSSAQGSNRHLEISKSEPEVQVPATQKTDGDTRDSADFASAAAGTDSLLSSNSTDLATLPTVLNASQLENDNASSSESFRNLSDSRTENPDTAIAGIEDDQNSVNRAEIAFNTDYTSETTKQESTKIKAPQPVNSPNTESSTPSGQNLKYRKESTASERNGDDFADVEMDEDDEFLKTMENKIAVGSHELQSLADSQSVELPGTQPAAAARTESESKIRFPIFNFSKLASTAAKDGTPVQLEHLPHKDVVTNTAQPETITDELEKQGDLSRMEEAMSQEATASLRIHFPSKKARRLVSRLRALTIEDISNLTHEEKRNLRIELLDFLMNLEHEK